MHGIRNTIARGGGGGGGEGVFGVPTIMETVHTEN